MQPVKSDTVINVDVYTIENYKAAPRPYEGHHPNSEVKLRVTSRPIQFRKGDWYIPMNQAANRFLIETLEPVAEDSYFKWNFSMLFFSKKKATPIIILRM